MQKLPPQEVAMNPSVQRCRARQLRTVGCQIRILMMFQDTRNRQQYSHVCESIYMNLHVRLQYMYMHIRIFICKYISNEKAKQAHVHMHMYYGSMYMFENICKLICKDFYIYIHKPIHSLERSQHQPSIRVEWV